MNAHSRAIWLVSIDILRISSHQPVTSHHVTPPPSSAAGSPPISPPTTAIDIPTPRTETDKSHLSAHKYPRCHTMRARPLRRDLGKLVVRYGTMLPYVRCTVHRPMVHGRSYSSQGGGYLEQRRGDGVVFRPWRCCRWPGFVVNPLSCPPRRPLFDFFGAVCKVPPAQREGGSEPGRSRSNYLYLKFERLHVEHTREGGRKQTQRSVLSALPLLKYPKQSECYMSGAREGRKEEGSKPNDLSTLLVLEEGTRIIEVTCGPRALGGGGPSHPFPPSSLKEKREPSPNSQVPKESLLPSGATTAPNPPTRPIPTPSPASRFSPHELFP